MKAEREHHVPLSKAAVKLLRLLRRESESGLLFPGTKGGALSDMSLSAVLRRMEIAAVPHGFRSTFRDWAGDRAEYPRDLAEFALAHAIGNKTEEAYRRSAAVERRRQMMEDWATFIGFGVRQWRRLNHRVEQQAPISTVHLRHRFQSSFLDVFGQVLVERVVEAEAPPPRTVICRTRNVHPNHPGNLWIGGT